MKELILKVSGMMCGGCENRIKNALSLIEGVQIEKISYVDGIVKLNVAETIENNEIEEIITDLGFDIEKDD